MKCGWKLTTDTDPDTGERYQLYTPRDDRRLTSLDLFEMQVYVSQLEQLALALWDVVYNFHDGLPPDAELDAAIALRELIEDPYNRVDQLCSEEIRRNYKKVNTTLPLAGDRKE